MARIDQSKVKESTQYKSTVVQRNRWVEEMGIEETNDCTVVAVSLALDVPYEVAHQAMALQGRQRKKGACYYQTLNAIKALGGTVEEVDPRTFIDRYPSPHNNLKNVTSHHPQRFHGVWKDGNTYLFFYSRHVGTIIDGVNCDHTVGRAWRVKCIYKITK